MKFEYSILIPAIRQNLWDNLYKSLRESDNFFNWELVLAGPFRPSDWLLSQDNVQWVEDTSYVSVAAQRAIEKVRSDYFYLCVDDNLWLKDKLSEAFEFYKLNCSPKDVLVLPYTEGGHKNPLSPEYWNVSYHGSTNTLAGVDQSWKLAPQAIYGVKAFKELGGFDCQFEYIDASQKDYVFRLQRSGGQVWVFPGQVASTDWTPDEQAGHGPVHHALVSHDEPIFKEMWGKENNRLKIEYDNWWAAPLIWDRRFSKGLTNSFDELWIQEGYHH